MAKGKGGPPRLGVEEAAHYKRLTDAGAAPGRETMGRAREAAQKDREGAQGAANGPAAGSGPSAQTRADQAEQRNVDQSRQRRSGGGQRRSSGSSRPLISGGGGIGQVVKALITAFALVILLGILLLPRPGGWSGAGVISTLLNKLDGFFAALVAPGPLFTVTGSGSGSGGSSSTPTSSSNQQSPNYRATPAPGRTGTPAAS